MTVQYSPASAPPSPHTTSSLFLAFLASLARQDLFRVSRIVAARLPLHHIWLHETAILDLELDARAPDFEKLFLISGEDMRGGLAFSSLVDKSKGISTILRYDIHLTRTYRKALDALHILRRLQNDPTEPRNSALNGENQPLNGAPTQIRLPESKNLPTRPSYCSPNLLRWCP